MSLRVCDFQQHVLNMRTRFPFKYGIAALTALPHLFVSCRVEIDGRSATGMASEGLPPKWFTKNPTTHFSEDLKEMLEVIAHAIDGATVDEYASCFDWWHALYKAQAAWGQERALPPLLTNLGVSLVERAVLDGVSRLHERPLWQLVQDNALGIRLGDIHPELSGAAPADFLTRPAASVIVRHTVGLGDPLTADDVPAGEELNDGLPYTLQENIQAYGLTHFKIKICGDLTTDQSRLRRLAGLLGGTDVAFTLDGNEQFEDIDSFREEWDVLHADPEIAPLMKGLLFVEQPLHRSKALADNVQAMLSSWPERPPMIIDESDATIDSCRTALRLGYNGTSHKNCKGVTKGIANACLLAHKQRQQPEHRFILSGEDLANVGPVALLQDLAVMGILGITHVERNGHHYFRGASMLPDTIQDDLVVQHGDLYHRPDDFAKLNIDRGCLRVESLAQAPFGIACPPAMDPFTPLADWSPASLDL